MVADRPVSLLWRLVIGFLLLKLGNLLSNLFRFPVLTPAATDPEPATVSLLVPMRDEAAGLADRLPALAEQAGVHELIVLDDQSGDGSARLARELLAGHPTARVVHGTPAPAGWVGKNWACQQLGCQATGSLLVFCDADIELAPGAITAVLAERQRQRAEVFSVFPRQLTGSLGERLITPLIDDVLLCFLPFAMLSLDIPAAATANGSVLVFTRESFDRLGGFTGVSDRLVEDVALARAARRQGLTLGLALGGDLVATRMYRNYPDVVRGLARGLLPVTGGSRVALLAAAGWHLLVYTLPVLAASRRRRWLVPVLLALVERVLVQRKTAPGTEWTAMLTPLSPIAFLPIVAQALRRDQQWKGRSYR